MAQRNSDGTINQPNPKVSIKIPLFRPQTYSVKSRKDATVDIRINRFNSLAFALNVQDEEICDELIKALEDAKMIMAKKRKKGRKV